MSDPEIKIEEDDDILAAAGEAGPAAEPEAGEGDQADVKPVKSKTTTRAKPAKKEQPSEVLYRSRFDEFGPFKFMGQKGTRNPQYPDKYEWLLPAEVAKRADRHFHILVGRIIKVAE